MYLSSLVIFILPEYEQWTPSSPSSSTGHICSPPLSLTIRLLWAFSFHGWGKVWTGEKQLRRLSTTAALVPTHSHASANSTAYTDFPQNQSESQSEKKKKNLQSAARLLIAVYSNINRLQSRALHPSGFMQSSRTESSSWTYYIRIRRRVFAETEAGEPR